MYSYEDRIRAVKLYINRQCCSRFTPLRCLPPCSGLRPETPRRMEMIKKLVDALKSRDKSWTRCGTLQVYAGTLRLRPELLAEIDAKTPTAATASVAPKA